jgi:TolB-like protein
LPDIFLSYGHDDEVTARRFAEGFERAGFSVWWDSSIRSGEAFDAAIEQALEDASVVVVLWSKSSVQSRWVRAEATLAERNKTLLPVMIEACKRPIMFELTHTADLSHWRGAADDKTWQALLLELRQRVALGITRTRATASDSGARRSMDPAPPRSFFGKTRIIAASLGIAALLLITGVGYWALTRERSTPAATPTQANATHPVTVPDVPRASIAVVPFANLTGEASKEYFSDGMADELINSLSHINGLKVPARTSSFAYKGRNVDSRHIAQDLGVATILAGSVQSAGKQIRVTAELVDGRTGYHLWSNSYDRPFTDIFKLQDELTAAIVQALQDTLQTTLPLPAIHAPPTTDVMAYQLYLQARAAELGGESDLHRGVALLDQAIARDPTFARAFAARATMRALLLEAPDTPVAVLVAAERDGRQALALDPSLAQAHAALAIINTFHANWVESEANFRKALPLDGNDPFTHTQYSFELLTTGHLHQAYQEGQEAYRLAPADVGTISALLILLAVEGREAEMKKYNTILASLNAHPPDVGSVMSDAARKAGGEDVMRLVAAAAADPNRKPQALQALRGLVQRAGVRNLNEIEVRNIIVAFVALGAPGQAYALTNRMLDDFARSGTLRSGFAWGFIWLPPLRDFRKDPHFQQLAARLHLIEYWQAYGAPDSCDFNDGKVACH